MFFEWLYPKKCVGCGERGRYICEKCFKGVRLSEESGGNYLSLFEYRGVVRKLILGLKFRYLRDIETELGGLIDWGLNRQLIETRNWKFGDFIKEKPVGQSISLYWQRQNWRGFNQAEVIAGKVADYLDLKTGEFLIRKRKTRPQVGLKREERLENLNSAFKVLKGKLPRRILLIDDVWTTGSTIRAAEKELRQAGVEKVGGLTLAR